MLALLLAAEQGLLVARAPVSVRRTGKIGLIAPPMQPPNFNQDQQFELEKLRIQAELAKEKAESDTKLAKEKAESDTKLAKEKAEADAKVAKESIVPTAVAQITVGVSLGLVIIAGVVPTVVTLSQVLVQNNLELNSVKTENKKLLEENKKLEEKEPPSPPATHPHHCQHQHPPTHTHRHHRPRSSYLCGPPLQPRPGCARLLALLRQVYPPSTPAKSILSLPGCSVLKQVSAGPGKQLGNSAVFPRK